MISVEVRQAVLLASHRQMCTGALRAIDPLTGAIKWDVPYRRPGWTGVLSTATGLVFSSDDRGRFMAVDATTGREPWHHEMTQNMRSAPLTYMIGNRQYVTIATYSQLLAFALPATERRSTHGRAAAVIDREPDVIFLSLADYIPALKVFDQ